MKVENTIRWREILDDEGNIKKESNARFVKWSDGSFSLHLGGEIFDVYKQPLQVFKLKSKERNFANFVNSRVIIIICSFVKVQVFKAKLFSGQN